MIAGTAYEQAIVQDLVFLTEKNEMKEQSHPDRIYGIDPGSIRDIENVQKDGEVDLFHRIDELLTRIWYNNQVEKDQTENLEEQYALEYCIYQTTRFGVEIPEPVAHEHLTMTASYLAWFTFYHHYFHFMLTPDEQKEYYEKRKKGQDISKFIPQGNWQELIPCFRYCVQSNKNKQNIKTNVVA